MKPALRRITINPECSFQVRKDTGPNVYNIWHHHPEIELLFIRGGKGMQVVGDDIRNIDEETHMIITGPNLPHTIVYDTSSPNGVVEAIVVHFSRTIFGDKMLSLPELSNLRDLMDHVNQGIAITGDTLEKLEQILFALPDADYQDRYFMLIEALRTLAKTKEYHLLSSAGYTPVLTSKDNTRLNLVYDFTFKNFQRQISIQEAAKLLDLSRESFCRYFKQKTGKSYVEFLMEVRIGHACRMLIENEKSVAEICFECGYNNASNFHHQFKIIKGTTPLRYQKQYFHRPDTEDPCELLDMSMVRNTNQAASFAEV
ncbi:MAG: helix-turn-helix domain-containing protein [Tannerellaceae bacterium]